MRISDWSSVGCSSDLSVDERGARLTLPPRASLVSGARFVREHQHWLAQQLAAHDDNDAIAPLQRDITAQLPLRGQMLPLPWRDRRFTRLQLDGDTPALQHPQPAAQQRVAGGKGGS